MNSHAVAAVRDLVEHQIVELEGEMSAWRHMLGTDDELNIRIRHQWDVDTVSNRKGWMCVLVSRDPATGTEPGHHGTQYPAPREIVLFQHLLHHGLRLRSQQLPTAPVGHRHVRPSVAEQQND